MKTTIEPKTIQSIQVRQIYFSFFSTKVFLFYLDILAAILGGVAMAIFFVNIVVCYICKR